MQEHGIKRAWKPVSRFLRNQTQKKREREREKEEGKKGRNQNQIFLSFFTQEASTISVISRTIKAPRLYLLYVTRRLSRCLLIYASSSRVFSCSSLFKFHGVYTSINRKYSSCNVHRVANLKENFKLQGSSS